jgi:hypothetical protein
VKTPTRLGRIIAAVLPLGCGGPPVPTGAGKGPTIGHPGEKLDVFVGASDARTGGDGLVVFNWK